MKTKIALVMILNTLIIMPAIADTIYRWTDPETGKVIVSPSSRPRYPIKEIRNSEKLPDGYMIDVTLDTNSPEVKAAVKKHEADEEIQLHEKKRIAAQLEKKTGYKGSRRKTHC